MTRGERLEPQHGLRLLLLVLLLLVSLAFRAVARQHRPLTSAEVKQASDTSSTLRVVVSLPERKLWVISPEGDTLRTAGVAVGSGRRVTLGAKTWRFATPVGIHTVLSTEVSPRWIRPDWAYVELARQRKLKLDSIGPRSPRLLDGGDSLVMRGGEIGTVNAGLFKPWPTDQDIVIGKTLYMPPSGSSYRVQQGVLGPYRLNLGGSVGLHGTLEQESVGKAVTHGCMRLRDDDVTWLYLNVPIGTKVYIF